MPVDTCQSVTTVGRLGLTDFRNYTSCSYEPSAGFNIVYGENGQGKTNLLEALLLVGTGRVLRPGHDNQAIRHGQSASRVEATMRESGTKIGIELRTGVRKRAFLNEASLPRPSALLGRMPVVSFSVTDLEIARGEPIHRRRFLDTELAQLFPAYLEHLSVYKRALEHRNALLKSAQEGYVPDDQFTPWEAQMAAHGTAMRRYREQWVSELAVVSTQAHAEISNGEPFQLIYEMNDDIDLSDGLERHRASDVRRGATSCGPHRDDLAVLVGGVDARKFASQGQQRTAVISMKLGVFESACRTLRVPPVLLLDDVFSDLDQSRRASLVDRSISLGGQVFLTCTEVEQAGRDLVDQSKVVRVVSGKVTEA